MNLSVLSASLVLLCASILGFVASAYWFFDLFNHFRVQYLLAAVVGIFLAMVLRLKFSAWTIGLVVLVNAILVTPLYIRQADLPNSSNEVSILSYNTWLRNGDWGSVLATVREFDPDIVYFTEAHQNIQTGIHELASEFHIFQLGIDVFLVRRRAELRPQLIQIPEADGISGIPLKLYVNGLEVTLLGVHPAAPLNSDAASNRDQSFKAMTSFLQSQTGSKVIVGDLNATPWSRPFRMLQAETGLVNSQNGFGIQSTWPSYPGSCFNWLLRIPIDHCLHSSSVRTFDRRVGANGHSNHHPVFIRLGFQKGGS